MLAAFRDRDDPHPKRAERSDERAGQRAPLATTRVHTATSRLAVEHTDIDRRVAPARPDLGEVEEVEPIGGRILFRQGLDL